MMFFLGQLRQSLIGGLPPEVAAFSQGKTDSEKYLGKIFLTVIQHYGATLKDSRLESVLPRLNAVEAELRGFAYEGAGMAFMQLDCLLPWKQRFATFLAGPASPYAYPVYVGAGLALARIGKQPERFLERYDPLLRWLLLDGYGFRYGIFARQRSIVERAFPEHLSPAARHVFDQGMGRCIWFANGADPERMQAIIQPFPTVRQADLWSGVGFACAYAGGADRATVESLPEVAHAYKSQLALGAALGAKGRQRAGNIAPHTDLACEVLCGLSADAAASKTDSALQNLPTTSSEPAFEIWRKRIEVVFAELVAS